MSLSAATQVLAGSLSGADAEFGGVSTDTRTLKEADLFVALSGPHYDGHDFLAAAAARGAAGAVVARSVVAPLPVIRVDDTRRALGRLAAHWRERFRIPMIAVTGSNGKTTVKEMIAAVLSQSGAVCSTGGNLNNDIGAPLTLLRLRPEHRYAVIELGMNQPGEIAYLAALAHPTVALITNASAAHLAGLGSVEDVAREKGALLQALDSEGIAIINADDSHAPLWRKLAARRSCVSFGLQPGADYGAEYEVSRTGTAVHMRTPQGAITLRLRLLGAHNVANALATAAGAIAAGAELVHLRALEQMNAVAGRLELKQGANGACVIDDSYNANPASLAAGLAVLQAFGGETVLVLGDMAELGEVADESHHRAGMLARAAGVSHLYALGTLSQLAVASFGQGGRHFSDRESLIDALRGLLHEGLTVLVKGSRVMQLERVVRAIVAPQATGAEAASRSTGGKT